MFRSGPDRIAAALAPRLSGRSVALVGNATSLGGQGLGPSIDACGLVLRINAAPRMRPESHGTRTDWLACSSFPPAGRVEALGADILLWMSPRLRLLAKFRLGWRLPLLFYPGAWWRELASALGSRPSTGIMAIDLLSRIGGFSELRLFGFDFFQSGSLSTRAIAAPPPHDFAAERAHVLKLMAQRPDIRLMGEGVCA